MSTRVRVGQGRRVSITSAEDAVAALEGIRDRLRAVRLEEDGLLAARAKIIIAGRPYGLRQSHAAEALGLSEAAINKILRDAGYLPAPTPRARKEAS